MTYAQLQSDFPRWSKRTDLDPLLASFIALFESRANRRLRTRQQETSFTGTIAANTIALPSGWLAFKTLWPDGYESATLKPQSLESVISRDRSSGIPTLYAIDGANVRFDGSGDITGVYYTAVPGLVANASNWLSVVAYEAYLFGVLSEAELYAQDEQRAAVYRARADSILQDVSDTDKRDRFSGPLVSRVR